MSAPSSQALKSFAGSRPNRISLPACWDAALERWSSKSWRVTSHHPPALATQLSPAEMACISHILGATGEQVNDWLGQDGAIELANAISLTSGEVASGFKGMPTDVVDIFAQTLSILAEGIDSSLAYAKVEWDADQVAQFHEIYSKFANAQAPKVLKERLRNISDKLPPSSYVKKAQIEVPSVELDSEITPSSGMPQKPCETQVPIDGIRDSGYGNCSTPA
ncbi:hypothetical protein EDB83DRAFT_1189718 [Lactarius deliciosus]|nr:hypothetical protein EDB83DRAFT_1189718 [Lactarius deliciosus]